MSMTQCLLIDQNKYSIHCTPLIIHDCNTDHYSEHEKKKNKSILRHMWTWCKEPHSLLVMIRHVSKFVPQVSYRNLQTFVNYGQFHCTRPKSTAQVLHSMESKQTAVKHVQDTEICATKNVNLCIILPQLFLVRTHEIMQRKPAPRHCKCSIQDCLNLQKKLLPVCPLLVRAQ